MLFFKYYLSSSTSVFQVPESSLVWWEEEGVCPGEGALCPLVTILEFLSSFRGRRGELLMWSSETQRSQCLGRWTHISWPYLFNSSATWPFPRDLITYSLVYCDKGHSENCHPQTIEDLGFRPLRFRAGNRGKVGCPLRTSLSH